MPENWNNLTADQKQEALFNSWLAPQGVKFASVQAEKDYQARVTRLKDAIQLKKTPDRVPVVPMLGFFPAYYSGLTPYDAMYDYERMKSAWNKYVLDFAPDAHGGAATAAPGKMYDILDYKLYAWPGHGVPRTSSYQALEGEYMKAEEYDSLIRDPSHFFKTVFMPRMMGSLESFKHLAPLTNMSEMYGGFTGFAMLPFGLPDVQKSFKALLEAGSEALKWAGYVIAVNQDAAAAGFPGFFGGGTKAPFDFIGDTLRGTKGIMMDMYRQPEKLLKALDVVTPLLINQGVSAAKVNGAPIVFIPLHKGADGFLSSAQFRRFYWPGLKAVMQGLIAEGCIPFPWAEGGYNSRLEDIKGLPPGKAVWGFDATDMARAKKILGNEYCVTGNVPSSILELGKPDDVKKNVKTLIDTCRQDGGYIMMNGATIENVDPANVRAMIDTTKEYGVY